MFDADDSGTVNDGYIIKQVGARSYQVTNGSVIKTRTLSQTMSDLVGLPDHLPPGQCTIPLFNTDGAENISYLTSKRAETVQGNVWRWTFGMEAGNVARIPTNQYRAPAVRFDGSQRLYNSGLVGTTTPVGFASMWMFAEGDNFNNDYPWFIGGADDGIVFSSYSSSPFTWSFSLNDGTPNNYTTFIFDGLFASGSWVHLLAAWDMSQSTELDRFALYMNDTWVSPSNLVPHGTTFSIPWNGLSMWVIASNNTATPSTVGDFADSILYIGQSILQGDATIHVNDRRKFIDGNGKPVNPAIAQESYGTPLWLFSGNSGSFPINQGSGGPFTMTGFLGSAKNSPSDYHAKAVHFTDGVFLTNGALDTTDGTTCSWSMWFRSTIPAPPNFYYFGVLDNGNSDVGVGTEMSGNQPANQTSLGFYGYWVDNTGLGIYQNTTARLQQNEWTHLFGYVDTSTGTQSIFINGVRQNLRDITGFVRGSEFTILFSGSCCFPMNAAQVGAAHTPVMDFADVWIAPNVLETDITKFRDPLTGMPKDPAGFPEAAILFTGDASTFATNQGTGGTFTLTGSLTDADSSPSN